MSVYFVQDGSSPVVKIGYSAVPYRRLGTILCPNGGEPRLLKFIDGDLRDERDRHEKFSALRIEGEWFRLEGDLAAYIASLPAPQERREFRAARKPKTTAFTTRGGAKGWSSVGRPVASRIEPGSADFARRSEWDRGRDQKCPQIIDCRCCRGTEAKWRLHRARRRRHRHSLQQKHRSLAMKERRSVRGKMLWRKKYTQIDVAKMLKVSQQTIYLFLRDRKS